MSIQIDSKLLAAAVKGLGLAVPIRSARKLADGRVLVFTRDGRHVWEPPKKKVAPEEHVPQDPVDLVAVQKLSKAKTASKSVSKPVAVRKRAAVAKKVEVTSGDD